MIRVFSPGSVTIITSSGDMSLFQELWCPGDLLWKLPLPLPKWHPILWKLNYLCHSIPGDGCGTPKQMVGWCLVSSMGKDIWKCREAPAAQKARSAWVLTLLAVEGRRLWNSTVVIIGRPSEQGLAMVPRSKVIVSRFNGSSKGEQLERRRWIIRNKR